MKNNQYWQSRAKQIEQFANNKSVRHIKQAEKKYEQAMHELDSKINKWYQRIATNNGLASADEARRFLSKSELKEFKWDINEYIKYGEQNAVDQAWMKELENASAKFHINRLEAMKMDCRQSMEAIFANGQQNMYDTLRDVYTDSYYHTCFDLQKGLGVGFDVGKIDNKQLKNLIMKPWSVDGTNFSEKLWKNKRQLINQLDQELTRMAFTGTTPEKAIKNIQKVMQTSKSNAARLILTEQAFFTTQAQKDAYKELDVEEFEFVATLDSITCEKCKPLDGQHFPLKDMVVGVNAAPIHPYCRCTAVPYFDDEFTNGERWSRKYSDDITDPVPEKMTYSEWKEKFVDSSETGSLNFKMEQNFKKDKEQYDLFKDRLGKNNVPVSFGEFQNIKYSNETEFGILKAQSTGMLKYESAVANEPEITEKMKTVEKQVNSKLLGLGSRIKTKDSFLRKIRTSYLEGKTDYQVKDIIRYTLSGGVDDLADKTLQSIDFLGKSGYNTIEVKNTWNSKIDPYRGINTTVAAPNGQKFEVQYHTQESFDLKNGELHDLYEQARVMTDTESQEYLNIRKKMFSLSKTLTTPLNIEKVK